MKQNILIVSYNEELSKNISQKLADFFQMRVLRQVELFEFDYAPRNLSDMIKLRGEDYVRGEFDRIVRSSSDYENIVLVADISLADNCKNYIEILHKNYLTIFLSDDISKEAGRLSEIYENTDFSDFYIYSPEQLLQKHSTLCEVADIVTKINGLSLTEIYFKVVGDINRFYS